MTLKMLTNWDTNLIDYLLFSREGKSGKESGKKGKDTFEEKNGNSKSGRKSNKCKFPI